MHGLARGADIYVYRAQLVRSSSIRSVNSICFEVGSIVGLVSPYHLTQTPSDRTIVSSRVRDTSGWRVIVFLSCSSF